MNRLRAQKHMLHVLKNCKPCMRKNILSNSSGELIKTLCEVCLNVLNGNAKISKNCKNRLHKYKTVIRQLAKPGGRISNKRKILIQKGGFLPTLLTAVLSGIVGKLIQQTTQ